MTKLTPFGAALRKLRIDKELRLFDLAEKLGKSTAMLSAIETGRKPIPDAFMAALVRALDLTSAEHRELRSAKDKTNKEVRVAHLKPENRELVAAFARRADELPSEVIKQIQKAVMKSIEGEAPFRRKRRGILVSPLSRSEIEQTAINVREAFHCMDQPWFPIIEVIEFGMPSMDKKFVFEVWDQEDMGGDEGRVIAGQNTLILRRDVYDSACRGQGRARFTAGHELGHYVMHHEVTFARASSDSDPIYCDAEWQADTFSGYLMMPKHLAQSHECVETASAVFGTSNQAAAYMLERYQQ